MTAPGDQKLEDEMTTEPTDIMPILPDRMARYTQEWGDAPSDFTPEDGAVVQHLHEGPDGQIAVVHEHPCYGSMHEHDENGTAYQPADAS